MDVVLRTLQTVVSTTRSRQDTACDCAEKRRGTVFTLSQFPRHIDVVERFVGILEGV
jgi:hypothetical protein